ncbi:MAG: adenylosuccinate lyase [Bacteroidetes bacterium]|nr:adenylosuccinate lyase [Bacteroidota bacterium]
MELSSLNAISPVDGRYRKQVESLAYYYSEGALINFRVLVEIEYFIALCELPLPQLSGFPKDRIDDLRGICRDFTFKDAQDVKDIEKVTNHDVKAVEYYIKKKFDKLGLSEFKEFIHFGLTSQDINNSALPYAMKLAQQEVILPLLEDLVNNLAQRAKTWRNIPMLARTHGQPASPTNLGKEIFVFVERLRQQIKILKSIPFTAKFGGATGNFNAHHVAYPSINWVDFANKLMTKLGLERQQTTTQIEHYDYLATYFDSLKRINTIILDLDRDMWTYISFDYFKQKIKAGEVGSSAMPHKVNPIDFENSEGNIGIANALFEHLSAKLPVSRLQRDLTDSTVIRNIGTPLAHTKIAIKSLIKGLDKLILNEEKIKKDLDDNWAVVAEAIQTILRRENYPNPYETLKELTRTNSKVTKETMASFIETLQVSEEIKKELRKISPESYTGIFNF